jgi:hypothetical protein
MLTILFVFIVLLFFIVSKSIMLFPLVDWWELLLPSYRFFFALFLKKIKK